MPCKTAGQRLVRGGHPGKHWISPCGPDRTHCSRDDRETDNHLLSSPPCLNCVRLLLASSSTTTRSFIPATSPFSDSRHNPGDQEAGKKIPQSALRFFGWLLGLYPAPSQSTTPPIPPGLHCCPAYQILSPTAAHIRRPLLGPFSIDLSICPSTRLLFLHCSTLPTFPGAW